MSTFYEDNMNIKKINGFTLQQVSRDVWAIDEFGIDIMYLIIGTERALLIDTGIGIGNIRSVVETMTHLPYDVVNTHHHYDHVGGNGRFSMVYAHKKAIPADDPFESSLVTETFNPGKLIGLIPFWISSIASSSKQSY